MESSLVQHPERWRLLLSLDEHNIHYILYTPDQSESLIARSIGLQRAGDDYLKAVENAIYDNPVLLEGYASVSVAVHTSHFLVTPPDVTDEEEAKRLHDALYNDDEGEVFISHLPKCQVNVVYLMHTGLAGFLQRTFNMPAVYPHLYALAEHFQHLNAGGNDIARMFINVHEQRVDMVLFRKGRLEVANSFTVRHNSDIVYFVLHVWDSFQLDRKHDEIQLTGDKILRDEIAPELRTYLRYVMPAIFPAAALQLGGEAMQAPIELIYLALCES